MSAYNPPESIVPIFNPLLWPSNDTPYSQEQANKRFVQTGTVNQTVKGTKLYDNLGMTGTSPFTWQNGLASINLSPQLPIWSTTFRLPLYSTNTLDDIVARTATQTLTNKTLGQLKVGTNGSTMSVVLYGSTNITFSNVNQYGQATQSVSFGTTMPSTPRIYLTLANANGGTEVATVFHARSVSTTGFTINGMYFFTTANQTFTVSINWLAISS